MTVRTLWLMMGSVVAFGLLACGATGPAARADHRAERPGVSIRVVGEGTGPLVLLLPSRGRDSLDYDEVAAGLAAAGHRVLRPQPRGMAGSTGPLDGLTLHDLAADVAAVIEHERAGPAVIVGHAYGNWVARMTAVDHPTLVRGVVIAAAAAKHYPPELSSRVTASADLSRPAEARLADLRIAFFAPGNDPSVWLTGWHEAASNAQRAAGVATDQAQWWSGGAAPMLDLQAAEDPFRPPGTEQEIRDELGDRVTVDVVEHASHALIPERPAEVTRAITAWLARLPAEERAGS